MKISIEYVRYFKEDGVQQFEWRPMFIHDNTLNFSEIIPSLINFNKIRLTSDCNAVQLQTDEIQFLSKQSQDMVGPNDQVLALSYYQLYHYVSVLVDLENREDWMRENILELLRTQIIISEYFGRKNFPLMIR